MGPESLHPRQPPLRRHRSVPGGRRPLPPPGPDRRVHAARLQPANLHGRLAGLVRAVLRSRPHPSGHPRDRLHQLELGRLPAMVRLGRRPHRNRLIKPPATTPHRAPAPAVRPRTPHRIGSTSRPPATPGCINFHSFRQVSPRPRHIGSSRYPIRVLPNPVLVVYICWGPPISLQRSPQNVAP